MKHAEPQTWYAYVHTSGTIIVHPYRCLDDLTTAWDSPYVIKVSYLFEANNRKDAEEKAERILAPGADNND